MMLSAIYSKEWLKLKRYAYTLSAAAVIIGAYFWFELAGQYANIEPESMMWYRLAHLGDKPYSWLLYCFVLTGTIVAGLQYVPEATGKKVRILTHLPISLNQVVLKHIWAGVLMILVVNATLAGIAVLAFTQYYPVNIVQAAARDMLFAQMPAIAVYLGFAAVIIENDWGRKWSKLLLGVMVGFVLLKEQYQPIDLLGIVAIGWLLLPIMDSFLSVKTRRIQHPLYLLSIPAIFVLFAGLAGARLYDEYAVKHNKYYLFYSPLLNEFVYQENGPNHSFFYGSSSEKLDKSQFEEALPFVYWKNLDIQGRLPVEIDGVSYDKNQIRRARMSLQYDASRLSKPQVSIFPLFNPISHKGSIRFPENMLSLQAERFEVYAAETAKPNSQLAAEVNGLAQRAAVAFPVREVWGKTTNMKPFDWGYFIKDDQGKLFNLRRADNQVLLKPVPVAEQVGEIVYIQVAENRHKQFYGYAISDSSKVYLIAYPDYQLIPLEMEGFDYRSMSFQLLSDPLYYLMRYDDGKQYHAVRFSKQYQKLDSVVFE